MASVIFDHTQRAAGLIHSRSEKRAPGTIGDIIRTGSGLPLNLLKLLRSLRGRMKAPKPASPSY